MKVTTSTLAIVAGLALGGLAYGLERYLEGARGAASPVAAASGASLIDAAGQVQTAAALIGQPAVIFFGYTHCPDFCPTALATASAVLNDLGPDAARIKVAFITVDPDRDTPEAVRAYLSAFDPRILGLTGSTADIRAAARAFGVFFEKRGGGEDYTVDHTAAFVLTDAQGRVSSVLPYDASVKDLAAAVRKSLGPDPV